MHDVRGHASCLRDHTAPCPRGTSASDGSPYPLWVFGGVDMMSVLSRHLSITPQRGPRDATTPDVGEAIVSTRPILLPLNAPPVWPYPIAFECLQAEFPIH